MLFVRLCAVLLLLQGIVPPLLLRGGLLGNWLIPVVTIAFVAAAWGLWCARRWAWWLALVLTALQVVCISSSLVSWQLLVGVGYSVGFIPDSSLLDVRFLTAASWGEGLHFGLLHPSPSLVASVKGIDSDSFVLINLVPLVLLFLFGSLREDLYPEPPEA